MIWIILALTLGASITSIIHGVFMLFGSLSISGAAIAGIPSTMLAVLPIISAIFALIGGIIAFNQSKWGALFLFIAMGLCAPARDTWLYGGLYFFAGLLCFFLRKKAADNYEDLYTDEYDDAQDINAPYSYNSDAQDFYYDSEPEPLPEPVLTQKPDTDVVPQANNEPPKLRRRMSKSCPECGAVVSRDAFYCPTCGAKLFVISDEVNNVTPPEPVLEREPLETEENLQSVNEQLFAPASENFTETDIAETTEYVPEEQPENVQAVPDYRVTVKPMRQEAAEEMAVKHKSKVSPGEAASTYADFSRYARSGKKRKRSLGRKVFSMLLLVGAVGGALYFLLGLRKLPPGELPPIAQNEVIPLPTTTTQPKTTSQSTQTTVIAEPDIAVMENVLPNFTPDRSPKNGAIIGSNVNVRADHTTSSNRVTRLNVGTRVEVLGTFNVPSGQYSGIWYNIKTGNREGWVYGRYLQPLGSGLPSGYSNGLLKSFGSNRAQLIESLGQPTRSTSSSVEWPGITATTKGEALTRIRITNPNHELQNGLKAGMSQTALLQIMGYPSSVNGKTLNYNENGKTGLSIQLDRNNSISSITVSEVQ